MLNGVKWFSLVALPCSFSSSICLIFLNGGRLCECECQRKTAERSVWKADKTYNARKLEETRKHDRRKTRNKVTRGDLVKRTEQRKTGRGEGGVAMGASMRSIAITRTVMISSSQLTFAIERFACMQRLKASTHRSSPAGEIESM